MSMVENPGDLENMLDELKNQSSEIETAIVLIHFLRRFAADSSHNRTQQQSLVSAAFSLIERFGKKRKAIRITDGVWIYDSDQHTPLQDWDPSANVSLFDTLEIKRNQI